MIEVKSKRTFTMSEQQEKITESIKACQAAGYKIQLWIIDKVGNITQKFQYLPCKNSCNKDDLNDNHDVEMKQQ